jgi:hypothetical protein
VTCIGVSVVVAATYGKEDVGTNLRGVVAHASRFAAFGTYPVSRSTRHTITLACTTRRTSAITTRLVEAAALTRASR